MRLLTPLAGSSDRHIQASALMRLGRISRRDGRIGDALAYYETLTGLDGQTVGTAPADWLGLYARCSIFEAEKRLDELGVETARLATVLTTGGRHVSATTYRYYADAATRWAGLSGQPDLSERLARPHALSEMAAEFLVMWGDWGRGRSALSGIRIGGCGRVLGIWTAVDSDLLVAMLRIDELHAASLAAVTDRFEGQGIGWRVSDAAGKVMVSGLDDGGGTPSLRSLALGGLLFTVAAFDTPSLLPDPGDVNRRRLLRAGLLLVLTMILASTYFISRSLRREAEISRLQSDFVAAVSHEFRTPLTSIRQLTELLGPGIDVEVELPIGVVDEPAGLPIDDAGPRLIVENGVDHTYQPDLTVELGLERDLCRTEAVGWESLEPGVQVAHLGNNGSEGRRLADPECLKLDAHVAGADLLPAGARHIVDRALGEMAGEQTMSE